MPIFQSSFSGAWLAFLGWFLLAAASAETRYVLARQALAALWVRDVMTAHVAGIPRFDWDRRRVRDCMLPKTEVPVFSEDDDAADALARLSETGAGRGLVVSNGRLEGSCR